MYSIKQKIKSISSMLVRRLLVVRSRAGYRCGAGVFLFALLVLVLLASPFGAGVASAGGLADLAADVPGLLLNPLGEILLTISSWLVDAAGHLLDVSLEFALGSAFYRSPGIQVGWEVLRDLANIAFITVLVYIAVGTILQLGGISTRQMLITLVVVALLVNFSFFFTGVIIDTSNILASLFYDQLAPVQTSASGALLEGRASISEQLMIGLELETIVQSQDVLNNLSWTQAGIAKILSAVALFIAAFVFLSGAILFIVRIVTLALALVFAPAAFAAMVFPQTAGFWKLWLNKLLGNAFVAPLYMLLLFILLKIIDTGSLAENNTSWAVAIGGAKGATEVSFTDASKLFLNYGIVIALLFFIHTATKTIAGGISSLSVKYAGKAAGMAMGATAFGLRRTAGRG